MKRIVSECGLYIAVLSSLTLKIYDINTRELLRSYDVSEAKVSKIRWEHINTNNTTKIALTMNNRVIIYDIRLPEEQEPMTIVQETQVEDFFWIQPVPQTNEEGAYVNSKQLIVFTKSYIQVKLYSLDCTHILWTLSKPISRAPILSADKNMWSLVFYSKSPKFNDSYPIIYHFHNSGSTSSLIYRFKLPSAFLTEFEIKWCKDLLYYFNCNDNLYGFNLKVFNSLGVNRREFNKQTIPIGDPLIDITSGENTQYFVTNVKDEIVVLSATNIIEMITVKDYKTKTEKYNHFPNVWYQKFDGEKLAYVKGGPTVISPINKVIANDVLLVLQSEKSLMIFENLEPLHIIYTETIQNVTISDRIYVVTETHSFVVDYNIIVFERGSFIKQGDETKLLIENEDWSLKSTNVRTFDEDDTFLAKRRRF